jgi:hypothetical protein
MVDNDILSFKNSQKFNSFRLYFEDNKIRKKKENIEIASERNCFIEFIISLDLNYKFIS